MNSIFQRVDQPQSSSSPGISAKLAGIAAALLEHVMALFSLAALEAGQLLKRTFFCCLLLLAALLLILAGYLTLLATLLTVAVFSLQISWPLALGMAALFHFVIAGLLLLLLYSKRSTPFFAMTRAELQYDLEALSRASNNTASKNSHL